MGITPFDCLLRLEFDDLSTVLCSAASWIPITSICTYVHISKNSCADEMYTYVYVYSQYDVLYRLYATVWSNIDGYLYVK